MDPFTIVAPTASADGYGCSAEYLILNSVREYGADIAFIEHDWRDARYSNPELLQLRVDDIPENYRDTLVVYFLPFALTRFRSRFTIGMSMWETDKLPDSWIFCSRLADAWIVPCEHSAQLWRAAQSNPVEVVPFGTDTELFSVPESRTGLNAAKPVRFLMSGLLHYRKGVEFALRAFREEFCHGENVKLTLKTRNGHLDYGSEINTLGDPRIDLIDADYTREQMRNLYWHHDCLLATSRGEGSGLTPRDAMATGLPVILTNWSGLTELADPRYSYPIDVEDFETVPLQNSSYAEGITGNCNIGSCARPSVQQIREAMRDVYENPIGARLRGLAAADWVRRQWTWERCAWLWLKALENLTVKYVGA